jgi:hypothetical protein
MMADCQPLGTRGPETASFMPPLDELPRRWRGVEGSSSDQANAAPDIPGAAFVGQIHGTCRRASSLLDGRTWAGAGGEWHTAPMRSMHDRMEHGHGRRAVPGVLRPRRRRRSLAWPHRRGVDRNAPSGICWQPEADKGCRSAGICASRSGSNPAGCYGARPPSYRHVGAIASWNVDESGAQVDVQRDEVRLRSSGFDAPTRARHTFTADVVFGKRPAAATVAVSHAGGDL